jgi:hypothetical protein
LAFALGLCAAGPAFAQNAENLPIVGVLRINTADSVELAGFRDALAALGLVDGCNIRLEVRARACRAVAGARPIVGPGEGERHRRLHRSGNPRSAAVEHDPDRRERRVRRAPG